MNVVMPLVALALAVWLHLEDPVKVALVTFALSPVPPIFPHKAVKAGGNASYTLGLLVFASLVSIVFVPVAMEIIGRVFGYDLHVPPGVIAKVVVVSILAPLAVGAAVRQLAPGVAERLAGPLSMIGTGLLVVAVLPVLIKLWPAIVSLIGNYTLLAICAFVLAGLLVGHLLGGPEHDDRTVLALSTATRHPGVAIGIAHAVGWDGPNVIAAVVLALLVGAVVCIPYVKWRKWKNSAAP
jgi:BASS family bile acid:Na+ symporter